MNNMRAAIALFILMLSVLPLAAQVPLDGILTAAKACPAVVAIKKGTNPDGAMIEPGKSYVIVGKNKDQASHYWIEMPGASPSRRWVAIECGSVNGEAAAPAPQATQPVQTASDGAFYILAISWQPAFCELHAVKPECKSQTPERYDASHFTLHGLWPQPRDKIFCSVSAADKAASEQGNWAAIDDLSLSSGTRENLDKVMPGTQSHLERHEWIKHGTCYPDADPEIYFADALRLMEEINASAAQRFMAANVGKTVKTADLRAAFDETFGAGAGDRIRTACSDDGSRRLVGELTLGLRGDISAGTPLASLLMASNPTDPGCPSGIVDRAGLQ